MSHWIIRRESSEEFSFDPDMIRQHFGEMLDAWNGSYEDFIIGLFEEHDGSAFGDRFFSDTTTYDRGLQVIERGDDE